MKYPFTKETLKTIISMAHDFYKLSKKEVEVLIHVIQGLTNKEVGDKLYIHEKTVKFHLSRIYVKMNLKAPSRTSLILKFPVIGEHYQKTNTYDPFKHLKIPGLKEVNHPQQIASLPKGALQKEI